MREATARRARMDAKFNQEKIIRANSCDSRADLFSLFYSQVERVVPNALAKYPARPLMPDICAFGDSTDIVPPRRADPFAFATTARQADPGYNKRLTGEAAE